MTLKWVDCFKHNGCNSEPKPKNQTANHRDKNLDHKVVNSGVFYVAWT